MRTSFSTGLACLVAVFGLAATPAARSATGNQYLTISGSICKPAGTNTNPDFVSKATGGRNESTTTGIFVVCPFSLSPVPIDGGVVTEMNVTLYSLDGQTHSVACTTVIGSLNRYVPATYSSKTTSLPTTTTGAVATWNAGDFGGTAGAGIQGSAWTTVTCNLPPQTAIGLLYAKYNPQLGN
ncbi:MAG: hypothetical protein QM719_11690 [Thermomonas sp.]